jgi:hypothetical protein
MDDLRLQLKEQKEKIDIQSVELIELKANLGTTNMLQKQLNDKNEENYNLR